MKILAIESSCDETSAAVVEKIESTIRVRANCTASSASLHAATGGIIPEQAAREQSRWIIPVISQALLENKHKTSDSSHFEEANTILKENIDAIAVTHGPGLIGSLLIGIETAKTLAFTMNKPLIPVNHLLGHVFANFIDTTSISYPFIGLIVSGGHTDLLYFESIQKYTWLGGTRDDAAGEALDKIGRLLDLPYPAGAEIEKRAFKAKGSDIVFKSPLLHSPDFDFSFSGLKTEVWRFVQKVKTEKMSERLKNEICFATQKAIIDVIVNKAMSAAEKFNCQTILLGGGVSANQTLRNAFTASPHNARLRVNLIAPEKEYCTDNAAMIGAYALLNYKPLDWREIKAQPELYFA